MYLGDFVELTIIYHVKSLTFIHWPNRGLNCTSWPSPWPGWLIYWMHEVRRRGIRRVHSFIWINSDYLSMIIILWKYLPFFVVKMVLEDFAISCLKLFIFVNWTWGNFIHYYLLSILVLRIITPGFCLF
jgi:hypothetical protein